MPEQSNELNFEGQNIFIGIDVHLKSWSVTIMTEYSHIRTFSQPPSPKTLVDYLQAHFPGASYFSAYEAGFSGLWAHYQLVQFGVKNIVVNAADIPTTQKEEFHKTDPVDSKKNSKGFTIRNIDTYLYSPSGNIRNQIIIKSQSFCCPKSDKV